MWMLFAPCEAPCEYFDRKQISSYYALTLLILSRYSWRNFHALCEGGIMYYSPELLDDELESLGSLMKRD